MKWKTIEQTVWERLAEEKRPIVLYGMGDGADKILRQFARFGIEASGVFASDEFVRGHSFAGFPVQTLAQTVETFGEDLVIVLSFASQRPEVLEKIYQLDARFDLVAPDVPVAGDGLFDRAFAGAHTAELDTVAELLADARSRQVLDAMLCFKLTGKIQYLRDGENDKVEAFTNILKPREDEHFVDLGAYNGDTIRELLSYTQGRFSSITALEPDRRNYRKLKAFTDDLAGPVHLEQAGAWEQDCVLTFAAKAGRNSRLSDKGVETTMRAVDCVLQGDPCTLLKMDVEGAEREALAGAAQTIARWKPRLNIACYHRNEDLFALPLQVHALCPDYALYLRHHPYVPAWDVNLYARPKNEIGAGNP
ncbi:FkbM family methyltransferase [Intestinibacillus sp. Marseille-P6563]|uniref:FkbM family methyltransferase n=1 Tax=Intestinibacillus sp. Marseille-P6563 TaxID=2364792 RepID=UPI000F05FA4F|nr:FkbM family methyltransferase [Intestinibacillus sp. Marseille-P6563]